MRWGPLKTILKTNESDAKHAAMEAAVSQFNRMDLSWRMTSTSSFTGMFSPSVFCAFYDVTWMIRETLRKGEEGKEN
jgi:hypothetical protein